MRNLDNYKLMMKLIIIFQFIEYETYTINEFTIIIRMNNSCFWHWVGLVNWLNAGAATCVLVFGMTMLLMRIDDCNQNVGHRSDEIVTDRGVRVEPTRETRSTLRTTKNHKETVGKG